MNSKTELHHCPYCEQEFASMALHDALLERDRLRRQGEAMADALREILAGARSLAIGDAVRMPAGTGSAEAALAAWREFLATATVDANEGKQS